MKSFLKKILIATSAASCLMANALGSEALTQSQPPKATVLVSQIIDHPALNRTRQGLLDALKAGGYKPGDNLTFRTESAQGSIALASQIGTRFIEESPDVVVGIGTSAAQALLPLAKKRCIPLVFSSVTDPLLAGFANAEGTTRAGVYGVSNYIPIKDSLDYIQAVLPAITRLGLIYNPSEANSVSLVKALQDLCKASNIRLITVTATKTAEVIPAASSLAERVEAIFITNDNTALAALTGIAEVAARRKVPVFVSDTDAIDQGAVLAFGPDQYAIGRQTGEIILSLLKDKQTTPNIVVYPQKTECILNQAAAQRIGLVFPEALMARASFYKGEA